MTLLRKGILFIQIAVLGAFRRNVTKENYLSPFLGSLYRVSRVESITVIQSAHEMVNRRHHQKFLITSLVESQLCILNVFRSLNGVSVLFRRHNDF